MRTLSRLAVLVVASMPIAAGLRADIGGWRPDPRLQNEATHVVQGVVNGVYGAEREITPGHVDAVYIIEIKVAWLVKGSGPRPDELLYARGWKSMQRPEGFLGPTGQTKLPAVGDRVVAYLRVDREGAYDLLVPNGVRPFAPTAR